MRKLILLLALTLAACTPPKSLTDLLPPAFSIRNPVTPQMLYDAENTMTVGIVALSLYKKSCGRGLIPPSCFGVVEEIQVYTRQLPPVLMSVRRFVRNGDQANAAETFALLQRLLDSYKQVADREGIK